MRPTRTFLTLLVVALIVLPAAGSPSAAALAPQERRDAVDRAPLPLAGSRTFRLQTDEGSWISLDVSPDGEQIVFDLLGDLYLLPFAGGRAARITSGMEFDSQPRFSPDGRKILFVSDAQGGENLHVLDLDERDSDGEFEVRELTEGKNNSYSSPEWTPDGEYVVATKSFGRRGKLWMWHVDGGSGIQLIEEPANVKTIGAAFGPDDRYIWFARRSGDWQYNAIFPQYQIYYYDRDTGEQVTRTSRYGSAVRPTLSPDGEYLVYATRFETETGLRLRELDTGDERWLMFPVQRDDQEAMATRDAFPGMSFTPDSREVVTTYEGKIWRVPIDGSEPSIIPFSVDEQVAYGPEVFFEYPIPDEPTFQVTQIRDAVPSPDGSKLAFVGLDHVYLMDWPGGTPRRVSEAGGDVIEAQPAWSPDGQSIAFVTWSFAADGAVYRADAAGGSPTRLTTQPGIYQNPVWSPDGDRIVAVRGPARNFEDATGTRAFGAAVDLVWIPAEGGAWNLIAPTEGRTNPHFGEESERIYLNQRGEGLISVRWDGTDQKAHVQVRGRAAPGSENAPTADWIRMAPVGSRALAQVGQDLYVVTVPRVGGETPTVSVADPDSAIVPVRRLTDIGGQFPAWGRDGTTVHWSIGNAHFVYDLGAAEAAEAAAEAEAEAETDAAAGADEEPDAAGGRQEGEREEAEEDEPVYQPFEQRIVVNVARDIPSGAVVLRGGRAITMNGDEIIDDADIVIENNRIVAVGRRGDVDVPAGADEVDISGKTVIPGFVDTHAHMWPAWGIHKSQVWMYLANLAYGVTTTRDPQTSTTDVITYADRVTAGTTLGPRVYSTGPGVFSGEGIRNQEHASDVLRRYSDYYRTQTIKMYMAGNRQQRQWIITAAREQKLMPTTEGGLDFKYNLEMLLDGYPGQEHSFPITPLYQDVVEFVAHTGMYYTPTLLVAYGGPWAENYFFSKENPYHDEKLQRFTPYEELASKARRRGAGWFMDEEYNFPRLAKVVADIVNAGGKAGVGSHGQLQGLGYHWELWAMQSGGLTEHQALRVATLYGAEAIGVQADLGSIEAGKLADLVIFEQDPLEDIRNTNTIQMVMKNGRLYDGNTLDELWPRQRELGPVYGLGDRPIRMGSDQDR